MAALGVWAFCKRRNYSAAACFGIAGALKIFPFVYVGLLLSKQKYREIIFSGAVAVFTTLVSLWLALEDATLWAHGIKLNPASTGFERCTSFNTGKMKSASTTHSSLSTNVFRIIILLQRTCNPIRRL